MTMKLKTLLAEHQSHQGKDALSDSLGDGYLLKHNPVYKAVRASALALGYRFTAERFFDYDVLPLTQLEKILEHKTIPYFDNVSPLSEIEKTLPNQYLWSEIPPLKANYLLHESAHGIARSLRLKLWQVSLKHSLKEERGRALTVFIEESFANACESMANLYSTTEIHDEFIYKNAYIMEEGKSREYLRKAVPRFGDEVVFRILFFSFLYANFVKTDSALGNFNRVLVLAFKDAKLIKKLIPQDLKLLKKVFQVGFDLDPGFTLFTNHFCLRLMGIKTEFYELLGFDFLEYFESKPAYQKLLDALAQVIIASKNEKSNPS